IVQDVHSGRSVERFRRHTKAAQSADGHDERAIGTELLDLLSIAIDRPEEALSIDDQRMRRHDESRLVGSPPTPRYLPSRSNIRMPVPPAPARSSVSHTYAYTMPLASTATPAIANLSPAGRCTQFLTTRYDNASCYVAWTDPRSAKNATLARPMRPTLNLTSTRVELRIMRDMSPPDPEGELITASRRVVVSQQ